MPVPLKDVAKFKEVLIMNGINPRNGLFFTAENYVPRARTIGIKTIDGDKLKRMEKYAYLVGMLKSIGVLGSVLLLFTGKPYELLKELINSIDLDD
eukprot:gene3553-4427_t